MLRVVLMLCVLLVSCDREPIPIPYPVPVPQPTPGPEPGPDPEPEPEPEPEPMEFVSQDEFSDIKGKAFEGAPKGWVGRTKYRVDVAREMLKL